MSQTDVGTLTDQQIAVLEFERVEFRSIAQQDGIVQAPRVVGTKDWWMHAKGKGPAIRQLFGFSDVRYYAILNALLDDPAAEVYDAQLIRRLRRLREAKRGWR